MTFEITTENILNTFASLKIVLCKLQYVPSFVPSKLCTDSLFCHLLSSLEISKENVFSI